MLIEVDEIWGFSRQKGAAGQERETITRLPFLSFKFQSFTILTTMNYRYQKLHSVNQLGVVFIPIDFTKYFPPTEVLHPFKSIQSLASCIHSPRCLNQQTQESPGELALTSDIQDQTWGLGLKVHPSGWACDKDFLCCHSRSQGHAPQTDQGTLWRKKKLRIFTAAKWEQATA